MTLGHHEQRIASLAAGESFADADVAPMLRAWAAELSTEVHRGIGSGDWLLRQATRAALLRAAADRIDPPATQPSDEHRKDTQR